MSQDFLVVTMDFNTVVLHSYYYSALFPLFEVGTKTFLGNAVVSDVPATMRGSGQSILLFLEHTKSDKDRNFLFGIYTNQTITVNKI